MIQKYWKRYLEANNLDKKLDYKGTLCIGDSLAAASQNCDEIVAGRKTLISYPENGYRVAMKGMPVIGEHNIIVDWQGKPACIIETTSVLRCAFNKVSSELCKAEMPDADFDEWQEKKEAELKREVEELGGAFSEEMPLVLESFRVVWSEQA